MKERILNTVDFIPALWGKVLTAGRINAFRALSPALVLPNAPTVVIGGLPRTFFLDGANAVSWELEAHQSNNPNIPNIATIDQAGRVNGIDNGFVRVIAKDQAGGQYYSSFFNIYKLAFTQLFDFTVPESGTAFQSVHPLFNGLKLEFPQGAIQQTTTLSFGVVDNPPPFPVGIDATAFGPTIAMQPVDTVLNKPAIIHVGYQLSSYLLTEAKKILDSATLEDLEVYQFNTEKSLWQKAMTVVNNNAISAVVDRISLYRFAVKVPSVSRPPMDPDCDVPHQSRVRGGCSMPVDYDQSGDKKSDIANFILMMGIPAIGTRIARRRKK